MTLYLWFFIGAVIFGVGSAVVASSKEPFEGTVKQITVLLAVVSFSLMVLSISTIKMTQVKNIEEATGIEIDSSKLTVLEVQNLYTKVKSAERNRYMDSIVKEIDSRLNENRKVK